MSSAFGRDVRYCTSGMKSIFSKAVHAVRPEMPYRTWRCTEDVDLTKTFWLVSLSQGINVLFTFALLGLET